MQFSPTGSGNPFEKPMMTLAIEIAVLFVAATWLGQPTPLRPLPYEMEVYFTPEEWYTELTRDEQDEMCHQIEEAQQLSEGDKR